MSLTDEEIFGRLLAGGRHLLGRFSSLTDAQRSAIPDILERRPVLLVARTAAGKTEAVLAPLLTLLSRERWDGQPSILYVAPTRALVNDLHRRLESQLGAYVGVGRRTGEYRETDAQLLVTTPESLDSMLARGRREGGHFLSGVRAIVIDELHLFADGARGTQLQILLARLDEVVSQPVLRAALSATVSSPQQLAKRFLGEGAVIRIGPGGRSLRIVEASGEGALPERTPGIDPLVGRFLRVTPEERDAYAPLARRLLDLRGELGALKALAFVPSRARCDLLAAELGRTFTGRAPVQVHAHHGSLDQEHREETERTLAESEEAIAVATSTLEVGIDIGDVNLVVLDGPPGSVSSLLQRVGRSNRRSDEVFVLPVVRNDVEACTLASMLRAAVDGELDREAETAHYSVALQQVASLLRQSRNGARRRVTLEPLLAAAFGARTRWIVDCLVEGGWLRERTPGVVEATPQLAEVIDQPFRLHVNIAGGGNTIPLVDAVTGQPLAWVPRGQGLTRFVVAGQAFNPVDRGDVIEMRSTEKGGTGRALRYANRGAPITSSALRHLCRGVGLRDNVLLERDGTFFHFGGALFARLLGLAGLRSDALRSGGDPRSLPKEVFAQLAQDRWEQIEPMCGFGPFQRELSDAVRQASVIETVRAHDFPGWLERLVLEMDVSREQWNIIEQA